ncbi:hypothetical protein D3C73_1328630 [compost metagenome]
MAKLGLGTAQQGAQRYALALALAAHTVAQQQLGRLGGDVLAAGFAGDQLQHHVHGRNATGAGVTVAVQFEQLAGNDDPGEMLLQGLDVLPMDGATIAFEQVGFGQQVATGTDAA